MRTKHNHNFKYIFSLLTIVCLPLLVFSQRVDSVIVGYGGGFTGQATVYKISKNTIKKGNGLTSIRYLESAQLKQSEFKNIILQSKQVRNDVNGFSNPYNMYRFLEIYTNGKPIKYTWGDPNFKTPAKVEILYNQIMNIINKLKFKQK